MTDSAQGRDRRFRPPVNARPSGHGYSTRATQSDLSSLPWTELKKTDILVAVMGVTGAGKSTFINHFCTTAQIGNGLMSCTKEVKPYLSDSLTGTTGSRVWLIDTPGFDDSTLGDTEVLRNIAAFLSSSYSDQIFLTGIVYLYRISDNRIGGSGLRQLQMFRKLCGIDNMSSIALVTTMWDTIQADEGARREEELKTQDGLWRRLIDKGATVFRQNNGSESGRKIVQHLMDGERRAVFEIQEEMVNRRKRLDETAAGMEVSAELTRQRQRYERELRSIRSEMGEALAAKDTELSRELRAVKRELESKLKVERTAAQRLRADHDDLLRQIEQQHEADQQEWIEMLKERDREEAERQDELVQQISSLETQLSEMQVTQQSNPGQGLRVKAIPVFQTQWSHPGKLPDATDLLPTSQPRRMCFRISGRQSVTGRDLFVRTCCQCHGRDQFELPVGQWHFLDYCSYCGHSCGHCGHFKLSSSCPLSFYRQGHDAPRYPIRVG